MPGLRPTHYRLTPRARRDLEEIWDYSADMWSEAQADKYQDELTAAFEALMRMPEMARERSEFTPPVRIHPVGRHLIVYWVAGQFVEVARVLGAQQDWWRLLSALEE